MTEQEREAFEAWLEQERTRTWFAAGCDKDRGPIPSEFWAMGIKADWWTGWQARAALAATPAPAPLTNAQFDRLYNNLPPSIQQDARSRLAFIRIGRAVEAAHGIGASTGGGNG